MMNDKKTTKEDVIFNQAQFQQERLNDLLTEVNTCFTNATAFNLERNQYNYCVIFNNLCSLIGEISGELTPVEQADIISQKEAIEDLMKKYPLWKTKTDTTKLYSNKKNKLIMDECLWNVLSKALFNLRININKLMKTHGLGNPSKNDPRFGWKQ